MSDDTRRDEFPEPGTEIEYIGPEDVADPWAAPKPWKQPYTFKFVSFGGTLTCDTKFGGVKRLSSDHPANNPDYWKEV